MSPSASTDDAWTLGRLLTEVIGSGPKSTADMSYEQAKEAFGRILDDTPHPTTLGAFLLANRWKGTTPTELAAYIDELRERSDIPPGETRSVIDCGANYDGKTNTAVLGVGAGIVAATGGAPVAVHASERVPASYGTTYTQVLSELGIPTDLSLAESTTQLQETGFGFYYQPRFHPTLHEFLPYREAMGVRTFVNTIETLANPANAAVHVGSFYHLAFAKKIIGAINESRSLSVDRVLMIQGMEGYDDIRPGSTKLAEWKDGALTDTDIESSTFGLGFAREDLTVENVPQSSATVTEDVLQGDRTDHFLEAIALNAALRLYAGNIVDDIADGVDHATEIIESGRAAETLRRLQST